jgi:hypothetical protein
MQANGVKIALQCNGTLFHCSNHSVKFNETIRKLLWYYKGNFKKLTTA